MLGHESLCVSGAGVCGMDVVTKTPQIQIPVVNPIRVRDPMSLCSLRSSIYLYTFPAVAPLEHEHDEKQRTS